MIDSTERNCDKCIHHINGYCDSWDCNMQTVEDVKKEAVNEYVKAVVEELRRASGNGYRDIDGDYVPPMIETKNAIEIVKQGIRKDVSE